MSIDYNVLAQPKGKTSKQLKARKDRDDAKQLKIFRNKVWRREENKMFGWDAFGDDYVATMGLCQRCGEYVQRGEDREMTGEVHHRISRRHKATRYDPDNGVLLCNHLVNNCHEKAERGLIDV